jgi:hypothetical protein
MAPSGKKCRMAVTTSGGRVAAEQGQDKSCRPDQLTARVPGDLGTRKREGRGHFLGHYGQHPGRPQECLLADAADPAPYVATDLPGQVCYGAAENDQPGLFHRHHEPSRACA